MPSPQPLIDQYQDHLTRAGKSPHTVRAYVQDATAFARWFEGTSGGPFNPQAVDPRDIQDYRGYLMRRELAPVTINRRLKALKSLFRWVRREKLVIAFTGIGTVYHIHFYGVGFKAVQPLCHPAQYLAAMREFGKAILTKDFCPVSTSLGQHCSPRMSFFGEHDVQLEPPSPVPDFGLPPLFGLGETAFDGTRGVKVLDITRAFRLAQPDEYVPLIPLPEVSIIPAR